MGKRSTAGLLAAFVLATGCQMAAGTVKRAPLDSEAEVWVYLDALSPRAERLTFSIESMTAVRGDGQEFPLDLALAEVTGKGGRRQRLLARGRVPPGEYGALSLRLGKATLGNAEGSESSLLVPTEAVRVQVPFALRRARMRVISLRLDPDRSLDKGFGFRPALSGTVPAMPLVELAGFATVTASDAVVVFDRRTRQVTGVIPTGRDPRGLAVDPVQGRLYVALTGGDEIAAHDLVTGEELGRARLRPGDRPVELALSGDRRVLVVTNSGSDSASFVDPVALVELGRAATGVQPTALLMDRAGRRAYAFNQGSNSITILDVGARAAVGSIPADGPPARGALNRSGDRLFVVSPSSAFMSIVSIPALSSAGRVQVGFGAVSVLVDPRTDYAWVGMGDAGELQLFAPLTPLPLNRIRLPGPARWLALDETYDTLLAAVPSGNGIAPMAVTSQSVGDLLDTGDPPYGVAVVAERH